jgi:hypothetical protein
MLAEPVPRIRRRVPCERIRFDPSFREPDLFLEEASA